jgi:hypothetical protein
MLTRSALALMVLSLLAATAHTAEKHGEPRNKQESLMPFRQLAGEWTGKTTKGFHEGEEVQVKYKVTSNGSAVVETLFPDTDHEMVTVIHPDGDDLLLTHYCALGNQPQMKAPGKLDGNNVAFKFVRATNMKSPKEMHMHDVTYTFVNHDTLKTTWTHYDDGNPAGEVVFEVVRKK